MSSVAVTPVPDPAFVSATPVTLRARIESSLEERLSSTLLLRERIAPPTSVIGIAALDALTGGLPRGALSEFAGATSSGRTGVMLSALAEASQRQEICALVDASDSFDPVSASAAGVDLERLLWVRCGKSIRGEAALPSGSGMQHQRSSFAFSEALEQVLKVTDLLLHAGGFGMVVLDLGDIPAESVRRIPLTSWFRFRRTVEPTQTVLLLIEQEACAKTCASLVLHLQSMAIRKSAASTEHSPDSEQRVAPARSANSPYMVASCAMRGVQPRSQEVNHLPHFPVSSGVNHADLLEGMGVQAEVIRSWKRRKPPQSAHAQFHLQCKSEVRR
jgi:recombination protein RecA